jgi:Ran GTPase-activating protein (RanGAP) involved in mRNA processing and transport
MTIEEILYVLGHNQVRTICGNTLDFLFVDNEKLEHALKQNTSLVAIDIPESFPASATRMLADMLRMNSSLASISLARSSFSSQSAQVLADAVRVHTSLTALNLSAEHGVDVQGMLAIADAIQARSTLTSIDLSYHASEEGTDADHDACVQRIAKGLQANESLKSVSIGFTKTDATSLPSFAEALKATVQLESLCLKVNEWPPWPISNFQSLAETLHRLPRLASLKLDQFWIDTSGAEALENLVAVNTSLTVLDLRSTLLFVQSRSQVYAVLEALKENSVLTSVNLSGNQLAHAGAQLLGENQLAHAGARLLVEIVQYHPTLTDLDISYNGIREEHIRGLADALSINRMLLSVNLSGNDLGIEGAQALAAALKVNTVLKKLDLFQARVNVAGAQALAEALVVNTSLIEIDLSHNQEMSLPGLNAFTTALKKNTSLRSINFEKATTDSLVLDAVAESLRVNKSLTSISIPRLEKMVHLRHEPHPRLVYLDQHRVVEKALQENFTLINILGAPVSRASYGVVVYNLLIRNRRRLLLVNDRDGLKNTILYRLFSKPLHEGIPEAKVLPTMVKLQITRCALKLQLLDSDILHRAVMMGWSFSSLEQGVEQFRYSLRA